MNFISLAGIFVFAAAFAVFAKNIKQPILVGYIFAGIALVLLHGITDISFLEDFGKVGVALLLFLVGLEMKLSELPTVGKAALATGIGQMIIATIAGFGLSRLLGFGLVPSIYIGTALTFSSTIIMVKLLSEKRELGSLYGRISLGLLLIQDAVAIVILILLTGLGHDQVSVLAIGAMLVKIAALAMGTWALSKYIIPFVVNNYIAGSQELLLVTSLAWALGIAAFVGGPMGLSIEIGGLVAGLALSKTSENFQIAAKMRPLRDVFLVLFFVLLGTKLVVPEVLTIVPQAIVFSLFVIIVDPIIVLIIMGVLKYRKKTSFLAGLTVAQISEFSFILMGMGYSLGHVTRADIALVILVGIITMTVSTYLIMSGEEIYHKVKQYLNIFERKKAQDVIVETPEPLTDHIVLIGCDRTGKVLVKLLKSLHVAFVVVDFSPKVVTQLAKEKINVVYGDISDEEICEAVNIRKAKLIISTTGSIADNLAVLKYVHSAHVPTIFTSQNVADAGTLYAKDASYVVLPETLAGEHMGVLIESYIDKPESLKAKGERQYKHLKTYNAKTSFS